MKRPSILRIGLLAVGAGLLVSCGEESVAGKTTTTSNGGDLVALGPDGKPLAGCVALAARSWNPASGTPGIVDTLRGDAAGKISLAQDNYAVVEIHDDTRTWGATVRHLVLPDGDQRSLALDTLRSISGRWADRVGIATGRLFLDSSFHSAPLLSEDGSFAFEKVPKGRYGLMLDADTQAVRSMGSIRLESGEIRYTGSGNVLLTGDTTRSPLWIDDFESGSSLPLLRRSLPGVSPWYVWSSMSKMTLPVSSETDSFVRAIGPDSTRPGQSFHARFSSLDPYSWVALGVTNLEIDLGAREQLCFSYRTDTLLRIQFQRDSVAGVRPTVSASLPSSAQWRDVCVPTSSFVANSDTPDSLKSWDTFGRRLLVIEFQTPAGGTFLDLDDIRMR